MSNQSNLFSCLAIFTTLVLSACGGGGGGSNSSAGNGQAQVAYSISGTVTGLTGSATLTLQNNGTDPQTVSANGGFSFDGKVTQGGSYAVTVAGQPAGQTCTVSNGAGSNVVANVSNISVVCAVQTYSVSGTLQGLNPGEQIVLLNNDGNATTLTSNAQFTFSAPLSYGSNYAVTINQQPLAQICTVSGGTGSAIATNVTTVQIACQAASISTLHQFTPAEGFRPNSGVILGSDGNFYGTTIGGGASGNGTLFKYNPVNSVLTVLYSFPAANTIAGYGLLQGKDGNLYGMAYGGGDNRLGMIFEYNLGLASFQQLHSFSGTDGEQPTGALVQDSNGMLYGTTSGGGAYNYGTIFQYNLSTSSVQTLHSFNISSVVDGDLVLASDGNLYGLTNVPNLFMYNLATSSYSVMHTFSQAEADSLSAVLTQATDGNLYGRSQQGGANGYGTIFSYNLANQNVTVLHSFTATDGMYNGGAGLLWGNDGNLYGTIAYYGAQGNGALFAFNPSTLNLSYLDTFDSTDGQHPLGTLVRAPDGKLYGAASYGGDAAGDGTIFKF